jgi:hypothetical protein
MSSKIITHLKNISDTACKNEEVNKSGSLEDHSYTYHDLYHNIDLLYGNFKSKQEAIQYLEEHKDPCNCY